MRKVLIAVDETRSSVAVLSTFQNLVQKPDEILLLHVERLEGRSLMIDMLGDAEMSTLKEMLTDSEHKSTLDQKAEKVLSFYKDQFEGSGESNIKTFVRAGKPAREITKLAEEQDADLILLGYSENKGIKRLITGSVSKDVKKAAKVPVLVARRPILCEEPYSWKDAYTAVTVTTAIIFGMVLLGIILQKGTLH